MTSVVIAAHNEDRVIARCLHALLHDSAPGEFEVVVVANGCSDTTVARAREAGAALGRAVQVLDLPGAGKAAALNAGDAVVHSYPRLYLDADVTISTADVRALAAALSPPVLSAVPARHLVLTGRPWAVRAYFSIHSLLPAFDSALFGRGVIAVSEAGRDRFGQFPQLVADDLFLDGLFRPDEKRQVPSVVSEIQTPLRTRDLVRRLVRVRQGNAQMRAAAAHGEVQGQVRPSDRWSWLTDVVAADARRLPAALAYVSITVVAALLAARPGAASAPWARDGSTRVVAWEPPATPDGARSDRAPS
jgi:glycosyltransferase involved in cell wall biosynthesis